MNATLLCFEQPNKQKSILTVISESQVYVLLVQGNPTFVRCQTSFVADIIKSDSFRNGQCYD